jgi:molybdate transport system substrate-binding protein
VPEFERTYNVTITTTTGASQGKGNTIGKQLANGDYADVVIMAKEGLLEVIADGRTVPGTNVDLAKTPVGVLVRAGAPKPDISTVEAFRQLLLRAKGVAIPPSTVGIYLTDKLFPQLGIADAMAPKTTTFGPESVAKGDAEVAVRAVSELLNVPGTDFVGTIPPAIQYISVFSGAVVSGTKQPEMAKQLLAFFASGKALKAIKDSGMEPMGTR